MDWLTIKGGTVYDGRYEFDLAATDFTVREWGWIKRHAGYLPLTLEKGFAGADPELYVAFAAIALYRARRISAHDVARVIEVLADVPGTLTIRLESDAPEVEEDGGDEPLPPPSSRSSTESERFSGNGSMTSSETSPPSQETSGTRDSATSESLPVT